MLLRKNNEWDIYKNITPENTYVNRRTILKSLGFAALSTNIMIQAANAKPNVYRDKLYPVKENKKYFIQENDIKGGIRGLTDEYKVINKQTKYIRQSSALLK